MIRWHFYIETGAMRFVVRITWSPWNLGGIFEALLLKHLLIHWGRVMHICVGNLTIIGSDNGLAPGRRQAIIWTNAGILSIGPLGTNFSEILIEIYAFPLMKMHLKMSSGKWRPFCLGQCSNLNYQWDVLSDIEIVPRASAVII